MKYLITIEILLIFIAGLLFVNNIKIDKIKSLKKYLEYHNLEEIL